MSRLLDSRVDKSRCRVCWTPESNTFDKHVFRIYDSSSWRCRVCWTPESDTFDKQSCLKLRIYDIRLASRCRVCWTPESDTFDKLNTRFCTKYVVLICPIYQTVSCYCE
ncbi:unknown [Neodiprion lecontei nucleopolyhedrovirus]|uniref:Uncharacterized protein n=1 Tax=Neodiprion lecontei nucleopolyhedrovirus (strain Canada) TaxID=654906 RepID=Q6JPG9_NPVNC|nr:unknown [Neodiprion lecontei nucleopolyhedrovirus]AAQ99047.1 unknown [Neodiprion lecontei nucleopolyhedrovirus]